MARILYLTAALIIMGGCSAASPSAAADPAPSVASGQQIYTELCAGCHGVTPRGGSASSLTNDSFDYGGSDENIIENIRSGIEEAGMPPFADALSDAQLNDLLAFIRSGSQTARAAQRVTNVPSLADEINVETFIGGLNQPWGIAPVPDSADWLVTEKSGALLWISGDKRTSIRDIPAVIDRGQGGLLDVAFDPDYAQTGWIYLTYSHPLESAPKTAMTKLIRGKIIDNALVQQQTLFQAKSEDYIRSGHHFGSRITFDKNGHVYFSIGDRGRKEMAQDITVPNGKIHRVNRDGSIPADNPFAGHAQAYETIYSYGNRNPQGLIIHPDTGVLWQTEHGPKGGDELNIITSGKNYGWPEISYGRNYSGTVLTPFTAKPGMEQPVSHWTPSIAVCGLEVYTGDLFPDWKGRLLAGALKYEQIRLIDVSGNVYGGETIILDQKGRVRDIVTGHDGAIYAALPDKIVRLSPK